MSNNRLSEGVGKKIVEALKKQSEIEVNPISAGKTEELESSIEENFEANTVTQTPDISEDISFAEDDFLSNLSSESDLDMFSEQQTTTPQNELPEMPKADPLAGASFAQPSSANAFSYQQPTQTIADNIASELDNFEIPSNIAVLKKLITQLPSGVTRHTGAQIIRQTMEALGISMKSVLQEAQQVQDGLSNSARECQASIQEYKKQIIALEKQSQNHQRQYAALNELISLFIQTGR